MSPSTDKQRILKDEIQEKKILKDEIQETTILKGKAQEAINESTPNSMNENKCDLSYMPIAEANAMTSMPTGQNRACNEMVIETNDVLKDLDGQDPEIDATW